MGLLFLFCLIILWGFAAWLNDDIILLGLVAPVLALIASMSYGSFVWLKTGEWGSIDVLSVYCFLNEQCFDVYRFSSYVGFSKINNWYISTNVAWTVAFAPALGNIFCTLFLDNSAALEKAKIYLLTGHSSPNE